MKTAKYYGFGLQAKTAVSVSVRFPSQHYSIVCNVGGFYINVLAYADDLVLLAPSWKALQSLLDLLFVNTEAIDIKCNVNKTFCMVFNPRDCTQIVAKAFPQFHLGGFQMQFVPVFKYLGHMITNNLSDDNDIKREIRNMFYQFAYSSFL